MNTTMTENPVVFVAFVVWVSVWVVVISWTTYDSIRSYREGKRFEAMTRRLAREAWEEVYK